MAVVRPGEVVRDLQSCITKVDREMTLNLEAPGTDQKADSPSDIRSC